MPETRLLWRLMRDAGRPPLPFSLVLVGALLALVWAMLLVLLTNIVHYGFYGGISGTAAGRLRPSWLDLSPWLPAGFTPLAQVGMLLLALAAVMAAMAVLTAIYYRLVAAARAAGETALLRMLADKGQRLAQGMTVTAGRTLQFDCLEYHLPRVSLVAQLWWRTIPRAPLVGAASAALMFAVAPLMTAVTLVAVGLIVILLQAVQRRTQHRGAVLAHRTEQLRRDVVDLVARAPWIEMVHDPATVQGRLNEGLARYRQGVHKSVAGRMRAVPITLLMVGIVGVVLLFVGVVRVALSGSPISPASVVLFLASGGGLGWAGRRLRILMRELRSASASLEQLDRYLRLPTPAPVAGAAQVQRITGSIALQNVVLEDVAGRRLLNGVTVELTPKMLLGIVSIDPDQAHALVELALGLGCPKSGRVLIDGRSTDQLDPESLRRRAHWVAADGALLLGTLRDNLIDGERISDLDLTECIKDVGLEDILRQLDEGLATVITPDDERLPMEMRFRVGLARALLKKPDVCAIEEPPSSGDLHVDARTLDSQRRLAQQETITLVLPRRLATLRACDRVVLLDAGRVVDEGTHAELLKRCELYRHLNYLQFNAARRSE